MDPTQGSIAPLGNLCFDIVEGGKAAAKGYALAKELRRNSAMRHQDFDRLASLSVEGLGLTARAANHGDVWELFWDGPTMHLIGGITQGTQPRSVCTVPVCPVRSHRPRFWGPFADVCFTKIGRMDCSLVHGCMLSATWAFLARCRLCRIMNGFACGFAALLKLHVAVCDSAVMPRTCTL